MIATLSEPGIAPIAALELLPCAVATKPPTRAARVVSRSSDEYCELVARHRIAAHPDRLADVHPVLRNGLTAERLRNSRSSSPAGAPMTNDPGETRRSSGQVGQSFTAVGCCPHAGSASDAAKIAAPQSLIAYLCLAQSRQYTNGLPMFVSVRSSRSVRWLHSSPAISTYWQSFQSLGAWDTRHSLPRRSAWKHRQP